jgi:hypothetical protein
LFTGIAKDWGGTLADRNVVACLTAAVSVNAVGSVNVDAKARRACGRVPGSERGRLIEVGKDTIEFLATANGRVV